jgi:hypothetical protein
MKPVQQRPSTQHAQCLKGVSGGFAGKDRPDDAVVEAPARTNAPFYGRIINSMNHIF